MKLITLDANAEQLKAYHDFFANDETIQHVDESKSGLEGMHLLEKHEPDVVILSLILDDYDGFFLLKYMKKMNKQPLVIIVNSFVHELTVKKAMEDGAAYFMAKPVDLSVLRERILEFYDANANFNNLESPVELKRNTVYIGERKDPYEQRLDERISTIFMTVGIPANIRGYQYLRQAIKLTVENPTIINSITKQLYPAVAEHFDASASKVERAIRHAIEVAWNKGNAESINQLFGIKIYNNFQKPTNGEFIALISDKLLLEGA